MREIWKDIENYEGIYQISNLGNVRKIAPFSKHMDCSIDKPYEMKKTKSSTGYLHVQLCKDKKYKTINVHKLVASAFVPNPNNKPEINHIDTNRSNNISTNLEWVTHTENIYHSIRSGNINPYIMHDQRSKKPYSVLQYSLDGEFIKEWFCTKDAVDALGANYSSICACLNGINKSSAGYIWRKRHLNDDIESKVQPKIDLTGKEPRKRRKILQLDKQNNIIRIWDDYVELSNSDLFGAYPLGNILKCINGKRKSAYGYIWKYI